MASEQNVRQEEAPPERQMADQDNNVESAAPSAPSDKDMVEQTNQTSDQKNDLESSAPSAPPERDMAEETNQTQGQTPPYPYQEQPLQTEKSSDYPPHPEFHKEESHNEQQKVQREERWGTPAQMGAPANPDSHPANKEAASGNMTDRNAPNVQDTPDASSQVQKGKLSFVDVRADVQEFSKKMEILVGHLWGHLTTGSSIKDTAIGRVNAGTRILTHGGFQGLYSALFPSDDEKLKKTYACFLSTSTGPVAGTLFISNKRLAFCSDRPLQYTSSAGAPSPSAPASAQGGIPNQDNPASQENGAPKDQNVAQENVNSPQGQDAAAAPQGDGDGAAKVKQEGDTQQKSEEARYSYYKLIIPIDKIREVVPSVKETKPREKYIELITVDDYEFWFMGFVNYDKGVKNLQEAVGTTPHQE